MSAANASPLEMPTILVVDDEERNRNLLRAYLESRYNVVVAVDGRDALRVLTEQPVDLVLLDVMMPDLNGFETCRAIKDASEEDYLPVILLTALADREDRITGLSCGADDYLSKPVDRTELMLRVAAFLRLRQQDLKIRDQVEQLWRLQEFKDDLIALVVHDLRNPLLGIAGYLNLMRRKLEANDMTGVSDYVDNALRGVQRARTIADDLLEIRRIEAGELTPNREKTELSSIFAAATSALGGVAAEEQVSLRYAVDEPLVAEIDRRFVQRAVENLLANALKYSSPGGAVQIIARSSTGQIEIEVADRGPGIPDALKQHIFQRFGTAETGSMASRRGYGLGLYLVKLVAMLHGGDVTVHDREGGGSIFRLSLSGGKNNEEDDDEHARAEGVA